jgi:hypothetical protein
MTPAGRAAREGDAEERGYFFIETEGSPQGATVNRSRVLLAFVGGSARDTQAVAMKGVYARLRGLWRGLR